jgi:hypothetical protein
MVAGLFLAVASVVPQLLLAETTVGTFNVTGTASVLGVNTLKTSVLKKVDNTATTGIAFGSISTGVGSYASTPAEYVRIEVDDNAPNWRLRAYTKNFPIATNPTISTTTWGFAYGGLRGAVDGAKAAMGWFCSSNIITGGPATGNPGATTSVGWTFLKDERDVDDPGTTGTGKDESFSASAAYTNIAFGGASFTRIAKPAVTGFSEQLATRTSPFFWYLEADFSVAGATTYTSAITLELMNL